MRTVTVEATATDLTRLLDDVARGDTIVLERDGTPVARLEPVGGQSKPTLPRLGFMEGAFSVPDDFDTMEADLIADLFEGKAT
ncbi:type II toxin-antitoxin system Phd/YefM family antitoxin [Roseospira navarrensis]|uniref:Type II toxin-antitoxin system prevent-host-death family antitoxin n=1 Tax=Roseospira navarrensis TaxID=140058 RepID=A0A7X1ZG10_9PROT|nr:type II toxin-antitoxin system prevent-host-death family antitoxin [Roseospira navarrensis]MQX37903.1 type II toxin-antitoxin system prevent-host-death family antitoxin [Roseospira navarrensis]